MGIGPLGIWESLSIFVVLLVIFGPNRLPHMAKGVGQAVREFRTGIEDMNDEFVGDVEDDPSSGSVAPARKA